MISPHAKNLYRSILDLDPADQWYIWQKLNDDSEVPKSGVLAEKKVEIPMSERSLRYLEVNDGASARELVHLCAFYLKHAMDISDFTPKQITETLKSKKRSIANISTTLSQLRDAGFATQAEINGKAFHQLSDQGVGEALRLLSEFEQAEAEVRDAEE